MKQHRTNHDNKDKPNEKQPIQSHFRRSVERRWKLKELKARRKEIIKLTHESHYNEQLEMRKQLYELESTLDTMHGRRRNGGNFRHNHDFNHYYKHIKISRFVMLFVTVALWVLLFLLSSPATGIKVLILVMASITSVSNVFELFFLMGVKNRIMVPVENLTKGVAEIMKGNYTVVVDPNTHSEVSDLTDAFNDMARKLYEEEKLKEEYEQNRKLLVANISHDLKTPITSIQGYVEAINSQSDITPDRMIKYLTIIKNNAQYMNKLIDDLFLFAKLDMQKLEFNFTEVDMRQYMADLMEEFRLELTEKQAQLCYTDEMTLDIISRIDPKRFHQVVRNIIDNAVKYGPETCLQIKARLYAKDGSLCLDLINNGPGIPADRIDRVFERFYRVDAERTKDASSTGLGLAIARELIVAHGGQISVDSSDTEGTCFTIMLPELQQGKGEKQ